MNVVDIAILVLLVAFAVKGLFRGLLRELCSLVGLLAGGFLALRFHSPLAEGLVQAFGLPDKVGVMIAFLLLFLTTIAFFALLGYLLSRFVKLLFLGGLNRVAGGVFGLFQGVLLLTIVLFGLSMDVLPGTMRPLFDESVLSPPFVRLGEAVFTGGRRYLADWH